MEEKISKIKKVLKRWDLCIAEKIIFIYLLSFSNEGVIKISRYEIMKDLGISNLTLGKYLNYLSDKKLIYKKQVRANGRFTANEYSFLEERKD
ncbi:MAG: hypothetical protein IJI84_02565 [Clostridia bacterium]|nr:hypothetical protein [Clostridia bacterium]